MKTLETIQKQYKLPNDLYFDLKQNIVLEYSKHVDGLGDFMETLPLSLKTRLSREIHRDVFNNNFFKTCKDKAFGTWVSSRLLPRFSNKNEYLYEETDEITGFYFIKTGDIAFVLPQENNAIYWRASAGDQIGFEDYVYKMQEDMGDHLDLSGHAYRKFTVISLTKVHALELPTS